MGVDERIAEAAHRLTTAERRVATVVTDEPDAVAFGTVALVARRAATSGPTVVRLAVKLGYKGFAELQGDIQRELSRLLGPARDRIRQQPPSDLLARVAEVEAHNVRRTLGAVPAEQFDAVVDRLADPRRALWVLPGDVTEPVGSTLALRLAQLRSDVTLVGGSAVSAARVLAGLEAGDTLVAIDIRRYESWLVELTRWAADVGAVVIALTDGPLSPLAAVAAHTLPISAEGVGPFDSMTAGVALANALVAGVATRVRSVAAARLDRVESAWTTTGALKSDPTGALRRRPPGPASRIEGDDRSPGDPTTPSGEEPPAARHPWRSAGKPADSHRGKRDAVHGSPLPGLTPLQPRQPVEEVVEAAES